MAVSDYILNEIVDDPHIAVPIQSYPDRMFGNINVILNLFILKNRYPVNEDISCQLCGLNALDLQDVYKRQGFIRYLGIENQLY